MLPVAYPEAQAALDFEPLGLGAFERGAIIRVRRSLPAPRRPSSFAAPRLAGPRRRGRRQFVTAPPSCACSADRATRRRRPRRCGAPASRARRSSASSPRSCAGSSSRSGSRRRAGSSTSCSTRSPAARRRSHGTGWGRSPRNLPKGSTFGSGAAVAAVGPRAVSLESGEQFRAEAVVVATAGIVDEPATGGTASPASTTTHRRRRFPGRGSSSTARAARSTTSAFRARSPRATRRPGDHSSP